MASMSNTEQPPVNLEYIREMMGDDDDAFLREFSTTFLSDAHLRLPEVEKHLEFFDSRKLRDAVHSFSGSSTCLGADELHRVTVELETAALSGKLQAAQSAFENFHRELDRVCRFLTDFLERSQ